MNMKKLISMVLALVMMLAMSATAMAYTVTITHSEAAVQHIYTAYQILTGDLSGNVLSNIVWGNGISEDGKAALLTKYSVTTPAKLAEKLTAETHAKAFAEDVENYVVNGTNSTASADNKTYTIDNLNPGYYLIKDTGTVTGHDSYTRYMMKVVKDVNATHKGTVPTVDKQVLDETNDAEDGSTNGWGETADHELFESFDFKLIATLTADEEYAEYKTYKVVFTDTMSEGITFENIKSVTVDGVTLEADQYTCTATQGQPGGNWTLTIDDVKAIEGVNLVDGAVIEVIYSAHLNNKAVIGNEDDNVNKVKLNFSNNPNADGEDSMGTTEEDWVWVFTYDVDVSKVDGEDKTKKLEGAEFKLKNSAGKWATVDNSKITGWVDSEEAGATLTSDANGQIKIEGLDAGTYYLVETKAPAGYNLLANPVELVITAEHEESENESTATTTFKLNGKDTNLITVENNAGATLPETGAQGTKMIYLVGGILVAAAAILLITKHRMNAAE